MKRFEPYVREQWISVGESEKVARMGEAVDGDYVEFADVQALAREVLPLLQDCAVTEQKLEALVAVRDRLKQIAEGT